MKAFYVILAGSLVVACSKKEPAPEQEATAVASSMPNKAEEAAKKKAEENAAVETLSQKLKTEEDFEEEADENITAENLKEEVDKLEKQLSQETGADEPKASGPKPGEKAAPAASKPGKGVGGASPAH